MLKKQFTDYFTRDEFISNFRVEDSFDKFRYFSGEKESLISRRYIQWFGYSVIARCMNESDWQTKAFYAKGSLTTYIKQLTDLYKADKTKIDEIVAAATEGEQSNPGEMMVSNVARFYMEKLGNSAHMSRAVATAVLFVAFVIAFDKAFYDWH